MIDLYTNFVENCLKIESIKILKRYNIFSIFYGKQTSMDSEINFTGFEDRFYSLATYDPFVLSSVAIFMFFLDTSSAMLIELNIAQVMLPTSIEKCWDKLGKPKSTYRHLKHFNQKTFVSYHLLFSKFTDVNSKFLDKINCDCTWIKNYLYFIQFYYTIL